MGSTKLLRRKYDVPAGISAHDFGEHFFGAAIGGIAHAAMKLALKIGKSGSGDVIFPVIDVEAALAAAGAAESRAGNAHKEETPVHRLRSRREASKMSTPRPTVIMADSAFTSGLTPLRAMA